MAYFAITGSGPGIVGETLAAALNVNAMLWRTSPAATELEERVCDWLRQMVGLPEGFHGHINDTASVSTMLALAAARHRLPGAAIRERGMAGRVDLPPLTVYASDQAHSSFDKAAMTLGFGLEQVRRVPLGRRLPHGRRRRWRRRSPRTAPPAVCRWRWWRPSAPPRPPASTRSSEIAAICARERLWLHVDAAYAGSAAVCPELRDLFAGWEAADSIVMNPHKWLFTPVDCSVLFVRDVEQLMSTFSLIPDYLQSAEQGVTNLMDLGIQLGRRFRALKLWMVIRAFGVDGLAERIREHCRLARRAGRLDRGRAGLRAGGAGAVQRRQLPRRAAGGARGAGPLQRAAAGRGQRRRAGVPVAHQAARPVTCCTPRSATSARRRSTCGRPGSWCGRRRRSAPEAWRKSLSLRAGGSAVGVWQ